MAHQTILDLVLKDVDLTDEQLAKIQENWSELRVVGTTRVYEGLLAITPKGEQFLICPATQWKPRKSQSVNIFQQGEAAAPLERGSVHFNVYDQSRAEKARDEENEEDAGQE